MTKEDISNIIVELTEVLLLADAGYVLNLNIYFCLESIRSPYFIVHWGRTTTIFMIG